MIIFRQSVTVVRPGTRTDRGGNLIPDWSPGAVTRTAVDRVSVQPVSQAEHADQERDAVASGWRVYTAPGTHADVLPSDRVEFDGVVCEVVGEVARWRDPLSGTVHHVEFGMRRAQG